jgi:Mg-chelatase subunit ChlD
MYKTCVIAVVICLSAFPGCFAEAAHESVLCNAVSSPNATASASAVQFSVSIPGAQVSGLSVTPSQGTRRIMILLDSSGSMGKSNSSINLAMQVVKDFVDTSPATDQLALLDFSNETIIDIALTDIESFRRSFADPKTTKQISRGGGTALFDAMIAAAAYLQKTSAEGDSLFVISDGLDNSSRMNQQKLKEALLRDRVRVYLFLLGGPVDEHARRQLLETLNIIRSTGGTVIGVHAAGSPLLQNPPPVPLYNLSTAELGKIRTDVQTIHNLIENPYKLQFDVQPPPSSAANLQVSLTNPDGTAAADKQALCPTNISH